LTLIPGGSGVQELAGLSHLQSASIVQAFSTLTEEIDFLIVDLAAGISPSVMTFLGACQRRFIVVKDDPSSIADAYGTIKVLTKDYGLEDIYLIPNGVSNAQEGRKLFERINQVCTRFLHKSIQYLGSIEQDELILAALKKHQSTLEFAPSSAGARDFRRLAVATNDLSPIDHASGGVQFFVERLVSSRT
jgi:flagellar biosynthesis protein FlhG